MERYRLSVGLCLALSAASAPVAAYAQSSEAAPAAASSRVSDVTEVIVTARRREERLQDVPVAGSGLDVGVWIKNLANNQYLSSPIALLPTFPVSSAFVGEPRTYGVTLRRPF